MTICMKVQGIYYLELAALPAGMQCFRYAIGSGHHLIVMTPELESAVAAFEEHLQCLAEPENIEVYTPGLKRFMPLPPKFEVGCDATGFYAKVLPYHSNTYPKPGAVKVIVYDADGDVRPEYCLAMDDGAEAFATTQVYKPVRAPLAA